MNNLILSDNNAATYGEDIASVAKYLVQIPFSAVGKKYLNISQPLPLTGVQSGGFANLYIALIDKYGTVVSTDNSSTLFLR